MNDDDRKYRMETFRSLDPSMKNFKPKDGKPADFDPTKQPKYPMGDSAGEKPKDAGKGSGGEKKEK
jgi:hypothetical protein